ncbi:MAG: class I SAM-dependent methyltransferase [Rhodothermales bacterium]|nr:class I SAM-dependent methyltransferase [Rhodothermales bacterium]
MSAALPLGSAAPSTPIAERAAFWDARFGSEVFTYGTRPNAFLAAEAERFPAGSALLDIGCGEGRNAVFLAQQGHTVTALDYSIEGLNKVERLAAERGVTVETAQADLAHWMPDRQWDGAVCTFVHLRLGERLRLYTAVQAALKPGGLLVAEWFRPEQRTGGYTSGGPPTLDLLVKPRELRERFVWGDILLLEAAEPTLNEGPFHQGPAATVRLVFRKGEV